LIANVGGLNNVVVYHPLGLRNSATSQTSQRAATGPGGYTPSELRTAYDMNPLIATANGAGQTVAIFELDSYLPSDVNQYLSFYGLGAPKYSNVLVDRATNTAGPDAIEVELDMEVVSAIAPGATQKIYIGPNTGQGVLDTYNKIVTDNTAKTISTSWGLCESLSGTLSSMRWTPYSPKARRRDKPSSPRLATMERMTVETASHRTLIRPQAILMWWEWAVPV
jgi:kumamolisin